MRCQEYEEKLLEVFDEATAKKIDELVELYKLEVPEKYKKHAKNIIELIFHELVDYSDDSELYDLCEDILFKYNQLGLHRNLIHALLLDGMMIMTEQYIVMNPHSKTIYSKILKS